jgi:hypothetical protein
LKIKFIAIVFVILFFARNVLAQIPGPSGGGSSVATAVNVNSFINPQTYTSSTWDLNTPNIINVIGINLPLPTTVSKCSFDITTGGSSSEYLDFGFYTMGGTLITHCGATAFTGTGVQSCSLSGAPVTLPSGWIAVATTSNDSSGTPQIYYGENSFVLYSAFTQDSSGGVLPATINALTSGAQAGAYFPVLVCD